MSTLDVLQRSAKAGLNLIITHEPTFYSHTDETKQLTDDPVYRHKQEFVAKNQQVIWRFHDHWHDREPDPVSKGMIVLGHAISEDPGMDECAKWLKTFLPEMPIEFIPAGEPFWNPMGI